MDYSVVRSYSIYAPIIPSFAMSSAGSHKMKTYTAAIRQILDPRISRTRTAVELSVIKRLSEARPFTTLTISEVAKAAEITRKTLYARFGSLQQVVKGMAFSMFEEIANNITNDILTIPLSDSVLTSVAFRAMALPLALTKLFSS
jgi:AcrR family transcriptional regulator